MCGQRRTETLPAPQLLPVGEHPGPRRFLTEHTHPSRPHPLRWSRPVAVDSEAAAAYLHLGTSPVERTVEVDDTTTVDLAVDGSVVGVEFLALPDREAS